VVVCSLQCHNVFEKWVGVKAKSEIGALSVRAPVPCNSLQASVDLTGAGGEAPKQVRGFDVFWRAGVAQRELGLTTRPFGGSFYLAPAEDLSLHYSLL
jgi:hypothetical protein